MRLRTLALTGLATLVAAVPAQADTFTVNTTADTVGAAGCPAMCTIRNAITAAASNGNTVDDTIVVPAGTYLLNSELSVPAGATRITIDGAGASSTFVQPAVGVTARVLTINRTAAVTLTELTLRNGTVTTGRGGNVFVDMQATATLNRVRVTGGSAPQGGGVGAAGATALTIQSSLIDSNTASGTAATALGGGVYVQGQTSATPITIQDSTIASNSARNGGGIGIENNTGQPPALRGVTLVRNNARAGTVPGIGGISSVATNARFQGSIVAGNTTTINLGGGPTTVPGNCSFPTATPATDDGGNVTPDTDQCGLGGSHTDPQLAAAFDTSEPPAFVIPANSSAVDIAACGTRTVDQRGVSRPQGTSCDAGAYELDKAAIMTITSGPTGTVNSADVTFNFSSNEPGAAPVCQLTGPGQSAGYVTCYKSNAQPYSGLANGSYTFSVRDGAFPTSTPATRSFTVAALDTTITGGPTGPTNLARPVFTFTGINGAASFECRVDSAAFATCTTPFTTATLPDGAHTIEVRAMTAAGVPDPTPASRSFSVDATAPNTTINGGPTGTVASTSATFTYTSTETGSTFQCALDTTTFSACPASYTGLTQGGHTLNVRAVDGVGNQDPSPAARSWTVDTVAPAAPGITAPAEGAPLGTSTVVMTGTREPNTRVDVREGATLRGSAPLSAASTWTVTLPAVPDGPHTYAVTLTDAAGNTGAAATRTITVDAAVPETTIVSGPPDPTNDATPTFTFSSNEPGTFECSLDGALFAACPTPLTTAALAQGAHTLAVHAVDLAGNPDSTPATRTFTVDTTPPAAPDVISGPDGATTNSSPEFAFAAADAASTACKLDGPGGTTGEFGTCTSPKGFTSLAPGDYVFTVRSIDAAGNAQTTQRAFTVTVPQQATPTPTPSATPTATPTPPPVANQSVDIKPVSGTVLIKLPGSKAFVKLSPSLIKNGAEVDARKGIVEITRSDGGLAKFFDGIFKLSHSGGYTVLTLTEKLTGCPKAKKSSASAAAKKPKSRKLWGDGKGKFRTKGQYSAATVRGTKWLVTDTCTTTVTRVTTGVVEVQDFAKKKKVLVKKGSKPYTARAKKK